MICVAGLPFHIEESVPLSTGELQLLAGLQRLAIPPMTDRPFVMEVTSEAPWRPSPEERAPWGTPASLSFGEHSVRVAHDEVIGEFDFVSARGSYARHTDFGGPLRIMLRAACTVSLPFLDAIPLHSCAIVRSGEAYVFFGESGAGKTTIARASRLPVISDEMVAISVANDRLFVRTTGFGEETRSDPASVEPVPVAALIQLAKGPDFRFAQLESREAIPELLKVILTPPHRAAWTAALGVLGRFIGSGTPILRMQWDGESSPVQQLDAVLQEMRSRI